jgi:hypothetical protein
MCGRALHGELCLMVMHTFPCHEHAMVPGSVVSALSLHADTTLNVMSP